MLQAPLILLITFSCSLSAPACEPNAFCFNPNDNLKINLAQNGTHLNLRSFDKTSKLDEIRLVQKNRSDVVVDCKEGSPNVKKDENGGMICDADLSIDQFDKTLPISVHTPDSQFNDVLSLNSEKIVTQEGLTKEQRRQFSKAHAILMIFGWLLFIPTGFLFARLGKDLFADDKWFGMAVWFQIHRAANFMGVVCICTSMLCIFISQQWTWKGTGSGSKYWTEVHTDLGVISSVLAVAQPINSLFRCGPTHSQRIIFNWAHRMFGIIAYTLALTAIIIAAVQFKRIWNEPLLELVLVCLPIFICLVATIVFSTLESDRFRSKASFGPHVLKAPMVFWAIGVFFCIAVALSLLVVNGYKS